MLSTVFWTHRVCSMIMASLAFHMLLMLLCTIGCPKANIGHSRRVAIEDDVSATSDAVEDVVPAPGDAIEDDVPALGDATEGDAIEDDAPIEGDAIEEVVLAPGDAIEGDAIEEFVPDLAQEEQEAEKEQAQDDAENKQEDVFAAPLVKSSPAAQPEAAVEPLHVRTSERWGLFFITLIKPKDSHPYGRWSASCPFHRKIARPGCKKSVAVRGNTLEHDLEAKWRLKHWCNQAFSFKRQNLQFVFGVANIEIPPPDIVVAQQIPASQKPVGRVIPDSELPSSSDAIQQ